jgi:hypothetical protein
MEVKFSMSLAPLMVLILLSILYGLVSATPVPFNSGPLLRPISTRVPFNSGPPLTIPQNDRGSYQGDPSSSFNAGFNSGKESIIIGYYTMKISDPKEKYAKF